MVLATASISAPCSHRDQSQVTPAFKSWQSNTDRHLYKKKMYQGGYFSCHLVKHYRFNHTITFFQPLISFLLLAYKHCILFLLCPVFLKRLFLRCPPPRPLHFSIVSALILNSALLLLLLPRVLALLQPHVSYYTSCCCTVWALSSCWHEGIVN